MMRLALGIARRAGRAGEVPIGALVVVEREIVARSGNRVERDRDPLAHAEAIAIRRATRKLGQKWLYHATLYTTLEPCPMCAGAILLARVGDVVFGAADPKAGAFGSVTDFVRSGRFNHHPTVTSGVLATDSAALLSSFFRDLRTGRSRRRLC
ncbi:MAG: nucleoside deaminase [Acidobacteriota bacterium]